MSGDGMEAEDIVVERCLCVRATSGKRASMVAECVVDGKRCVFLSTNPKKIPWLLIGCKMESNNLVLRAALEQLVLHLRGPPRAAECHVVPRERRLKLSESDGGSQPQNNAGDAGGDSQPEDMAVFTGCGSQPPEMAASSSCIAEDSPAKRRCVGTWHRASVGGGEVEALRREGPGVWVVASEESVRLLIRQFADYVVDKERGSQPESTLDHGRVRWCNWRSAWFVTYRLHEGGRVHSTYKDLGAKYEDRMSMLPKARERWNMRDCTKKERYST